jgi:hypothetical protein
MKTSSLSPSRRDFLKGMASTAVLGGIAGKNATRLNAEGGPNGAAESQPSRLTIEHVTVIDTKGGVPKTDVTVVVCGKRIERVSEARHSLKRMNQRLSTGGGSSSFRGFGIWKST